MNSTMTIGFIIALVAGLAIGIQGVFINILGQSLGSARSGLAVHMGGTFVGVLLMGFIMLTNPNLKSIQITPQIILYSIIAGTFGMVIVMSVSFAFSRIGLVAGQSAIIVAQLAIGILVDTFALAGGDPLPMDRQRIIGLLVIAVGAYLLLPQQNN